MSSAGNSLIDLLKQNNVGGAVALPPTDCLRAVYIPDYVTAHAKRTGSARKRHYPGIGLGGRTAQTHHQEQLP
jgi:hypothetical protein